MIVSGARSSLGAPLIAFNGTVNLIGQNSFVNNRATEAGAAMYILQSVVNFHGSVSFINNTLLSTSGFGRATQVQGGALNIIDSVVNFHGNVSFVRNIAFSASGFALGGAICCISSVLSFVGSTLFIHNFASTLSTSFSAQGGAIFALSNSTLTFERSSSTAFTENSALHYGGAVSIIVESELTINGNALFDGNSGVSGGGAISGQSSSKILCNGSGEHITFRNNTSSDVGGAIYTNLSTVELKGVSFERNMAGLGGAIFSEDYFLHVFTCDFRNNVGLLDGGAIFINGTYYNGITIFNGTNNFQWNRGNLTSAVRLSFISATISGTNKFMYNNSTLGPGSLAFLASSGIICGNLTFYRNYAARGSGLYGILSDMRICGNILFTENHANFNGGGMYFWRCNLNITGQVALLHNTGKSDGSTVSIRDSSITIDGSMNISGDSSNLFIEGSMEILNCTVSLNGVLLIENNTAYRGGAISARDSGIDFVGCIQFINNIAQISGGALFAKNCTVTVRSGNNCNILFQSNIAGGRGGAIYAEESIISLSGSQRFLLNSADKGGAIAIDSSSKLVLAQLLQASFIKNNASLGGAISYEDVFSASQCTNSANRGNNYCFIELDSASDIQLSFFNNTASSAGTVLYGGNFDNCRLYMGGGISDGCGNIVGGNFSDDPISVLFEISESIISDNFTSNVSSDPLQVCFCDNAINDVLNCSRSHISMAAVSAL